MAAPTLAGFQWFIVNVMGISTIDCDPASPFTAFAFNLALAIVNQQLALVGLPNQVNPVTGGPASLYDVAVNNLAGDNLINFYVDEPNATLVNIAGPNGTTIPVPYFESLRYKWGIGGFQSGVVSSVSDVSTSTSLEVIEAAKNFTLGDLQNLKTPYGRQYLAIAQRYGTLWGLT